MFYSKNNHIYFSFPNKYVSKSLDAYWQRYLASKKHLTPFFMLRPKFLCLNKAKIIRKHLHIAKNDGIYIRKYGLKRKYHFIQWNYYVEIMFLNH